MKLLKRNLPAALALLLITCAVLFGCGDGTTSDAAPDTTKDLTIDLTTDVTTDVTANAAETASATEPETEPETVGQTEEPTETTGETEKETSAYSCPLHPGQSCECAYGNVTETPEPETTVPEPETTVAPEPETTEAPEPEVENPALSMPSFSASDVPAYTNQGYVEVNGNIPFFTPNQYVTESYEYYSPLDSLGRCGTVVASIGRDIMPTEDRESISSVKPTGWHSVAYPDVGVTSLYNRSHLIAFQLTGENANRENLITGTQYMNQTVMTRFENMVADYITETGNHVLYRVTPIFTGNNLVADGVLMEGWSVEDNGDGICYCVYLYNVQPGVEINYATGESRLLEIEIPDDAPNYILNTNTKKFHKPTCSNAASISDKNRKESYDTREALIAEGYKAAGCCNP